MAYAGTTDLLLGDLSFGATTNPQVWVDRAAEEMDSRIGTRYELPLPVDLAPHAELLLKKINAMLATGRMLMALDGGGDNDLHAYGRHLVVQATGELNQIVAGTVELPGAIVTETVGSRGPSIINRDAYSAVATFEAYTMGGANTYWQPGV